MSKLEKIKTRYGNITSTVATVQNSLSMYKELKTKYQEKFMYTAVITEDAYVYKDLMKYIDAKTNTRNFKFLSTREGVWRYYDSDATAKFMIEGHKLKAEIRKPGTNSGDSEDEPSLFVMGGKDELVFTARDNNGLKALETLMEKFRKDKQVYQHDTYIANVDHWGEWDYSSLPKKSLDSVFLPEGVKEDIVLDIENFLAKESRFETIGIPWHRGYVLYGDPGNGKSSIALALANHFNMDLFNLPLSSVREDKTLNKAISRLKKGSILLLEDVDVFSDTMGREQGSHAPTLAGLLNALDGVSTPHGLITIMTTNHFDKLDPALVRPGRMDYRLELLAPVQYQIDSIFRKIFDEELNIEAKSFASMAAVVDIFKRNLDDPEAVRLELKNEE